MKIWADMCIAAGINIRNMELIDVYLTAGKILRDEELSRECVKYLKGAVMPSGTREFVLNSWPEASRRALRERVAGVVQFPRSGR